MSKTILTICAALVALAALAIPTSASAAATLRENGVPLPQGAKITATQDEHTVFEAGGIQITCSENWFTAEVHTNDHTNGITGTITGAAFRGSEAETKCNGGSLFGALRFKIPALTNEGGTGHWCIKSIPGTDEFEILGRGCTETGGTFTWALEGNITCTYTRSEGIRGTFTTTSAPATLKFTGEPTFTKEAPSNFFCPSTQKITTWSYNLYTDNEAETPISIDDV